MRRTEREVKEELLRRSKLHFQRKKTIQKRAVAALLCLTMVLGTVALVLLLPDKDLTDNVLQNSSVTTPFDSSAPDNNGEDSREESREESELCSEDVESLVSTDSSEDSTDSSYEPIVPDESDEPVEPDESVEPDEPDKPLGDNSSDPEVPGEPETSEPPSSGDEPSPPPTENDPPKDMIYPEVPSNGSSLDLLKTLNVQPVAGAPINNSFVAAYSSFAVELFKNCAMGEENTLISPLSLMLSLAMVSNGTAGETTQLMELGLGGFDVQTLNDYLFSYTAKLPNTATTSLSCNNAIWIKDGFGVNKAFLQQCLDYYGAEAYMALFNEQTANDVNAWIGENTDENVAEVLESIPSDALMFLINALSFDASWQKEFYIDANREKWEFTNADGSVTDVYYLKDVYEVEEYGIEPEVKYIKTEDASGFVKNYKDGYAFVALLPDSEDGLDELVASMTGQKLLIMLANAKACDLSYSMPQFSFTGSLSSEALQSALTDMGMGVIFDSKNANFTNINDGGVFVDGILHNTYIDVGSKGTSAGAASITEVKPEAPGVPPPPTGGGPETVWLNRPFMYMIVETADNTPIFMGTVTDMSESDDLDAVEPESGTVHFEDEAMYVTDLNKLYTQTSNYQNIAPQATVINNEAELKAYYSVKNLAYGDKAKLDEFINGYSFDVNGLVIIELAEPTHNISHRVSDVSYYSDAYGFKLDIVIDTTGGNEPPENTTCYLIVELNSSYTRLDAEINVSFTGVRNELAQSVKN